jgi:hypothetical protein
LPSVNRDEPDDNEIDLELKRFIKEQKLVWKRELEQLRSKAPSNVVELFPTVKRIG